MFVRRVIVIFVLVACVAMVLVLRLAHMQLAHAERWREQARLVAHRHHVIETGRGDILDRRGRVVAREEPCSDLAIDYRAVVLDDRWIAARAVALLKKEGVANRRDRIPLMADAKARVVGQIERIPLALQEHCGLSAEEVREKYNEIRWRIAALRQDILIKKWDREADKLNAEEGLIDPDSPDTLRDEQIPHTLLPNVPEEVANHFRKVLDDYPGLVVVSSKRREYPFGEVGAHMVGYLRPVSREDVNAWRFDRPDLLTDQPGDLKGYLPGDTIGAIGVEAYAEKLLRGTRGVRLVRRGGEEVVEKRQEAESGQSVRMTIDMALQEDLTGRILDPDGRLMIGQDGQKHNVTLVILDISNGDVLAAITTPTFDLNDVGSQMRGMLKDRKNAPLLNRAIAGQYPPGSTVKPMVAQAALAAGVVTPGERVTCNGHLYPRNPRAYRCSVFTERGSVHGPVEVMGAIECSCNIYFYTMGQRLGMDHLVQAYSAYGFGRETGLGLMEERAGRLVKPESVRDADMARHESTMLGIGQGQIVCTPLQMAQAYATLLRGGVAIPPRVLADEKREAVQALTIDPRHMALVRKGMELVVSGAHGTAANRLTRVNGLRTTSGGKTGSATDHTPAWTDDGQPVPDYTRPRRDRAGNPVLDEKGQPTYYQMSLEGTDAWYCGYVPADRPRYVIVAMMEFGGHGGAAAVPLFKEAVLALQRHEAEPGRTYLPPVDVE